MLGLVVADVVFVDWRVPSLAGTSCGRLIFCSCGPKSSNFKFSVALTVEVLQTSQQVPAPTYPYLRQPVKSVAAHHPIDRFFSIQASAMFVRLFPLAVILALNLISPAEGFSVRPLVKSVVVQTRVVRFAEEDDGVVELGDVGEPEGSSSSVGVTPEPAQFAAPFLSQGEISEEALNPDLSDPKQTRVLIYIILSLVPVLFLIPLILGSRDLIPPEALPPVEMN